MCFECDILCVCLYIYDYQITCISAYLELQKRRKSLEIEKAKFFSDLIEGSRYSFSSGDSTHRILQKETQKCLDTVLTAANSLRPIENLTTQEIKSPEPNIEQVSSIMVDFVTASPELY